MPGRLEATRTAVLPDRWTEVTERGSTKYHNERTGETKNPFPHGGVLFHENIFYTPGKQLDPIKDWKELLDDDRRRNFGMPVASCTMPAARHALCSRWDVYGYTLLKLTPNGQPEKAFECIKKSGFAHAGGYTCGSELLKTICPCDLGRKLLLGAPMPTCTNQKCKMKMCGTYTKEGNSAAKFGTGWIRNTETPMTWTVCKRRRSWFGRRLGNTQTQRPVWHHQRPFLRPCYNGCVREQTCPRCAI